MAPYSNNTHSLNFRLTKYHCLHHSTAFMAAAFHPFFGQQIVGPLQDKVPSGAAAAHSASAA
jgi:hypothetical protein